MKSDDNNYEELISDTDIRYIFIAEKVSNKLSSFKHHMPKQGFEKYLKYKNILFNLPNIIIIFLIFLVIFSKPDWCIKLGPKIDVLLIESM